MKPMTCLGCGETMVLAFTNRQLNPNRYLLFCKTCAPTFWVDKHWITVNQVGAAIARPINCMGCDKSVYVSMANAHIRHVIAFCFGCKRKLLNQHQWDECRRGDNEAEYDGYAPAAIVPGTIKGGH